MDYCSLEVIGYSMKGCFCIISLSVLLCSSRFTFQSSIHLVGCIAHSCHNGIYIGTATQQLGLIEFAEKQPP